MSNALASTNLCGAIWEFMFQIGAKLLPLLTQNAGIRETMSTAANSNMYLMFDWTMESVSMHNADLVL